MSSKNSETPLKDRIDWITVIVPFLAILALCVCFIMMPDASKSVLDTIRFILGDTFGLFYLAVGLFVFLLSLFLAFSRFGNIRLGKPDEKPKYPLFVWASMMFTSGLAADILFYSFCEWILYANDPHISEMGSMQTCSPCASASCFMSADAISRNTLRHAAHFSETKSMDSREN